MNLAMLKQYREIGVKRFQQYSETNFEVEFFEDKPKTQDLDTVALTKALADPMPPESAMLFAAVEDPAPQPLTPEVPSA